MSIRNQSAFIGDSVYSIPLNYSTANSCWCQYAECFIYRWKHCWSTRSHQHIFATANTPSPTCVWDSKSVRGRDLDECTELYFFRHWFSLSKLNWVNYSPNMLRLQSPHIKFKLGFPQACESHPEHLNLIRFEVFSNLVTNCNFGFESAGIGSLYPASAVSESSFT